MRNQNNEPKRDSLASKMFERAVRRDVWKTEGLARERCRLSSARWQTWRSKLFKYSS